MNRQIFRPAALERMSSPEQLDRLMQVTSPRGWVALSALGIIFLATLLWGLFGTVYTTAEGQGILIRVWDTPDDKRDEGVKSVVAPYGGVVSKVLVQPGDMVEERQRVAQLDVHSLYSTYAGRVLEVFVHNGSAVERGTILLTVEPTSSELEAAIYIPVGDGERVEPGMQVNLAPTTAKKSEFGYLRGTVTWVGRFPASHKGMLRLLENEELVHSLTQDSPCLLIKADLVPDSTTVSGYAWSSSKGPPAPLYSGTPCRARITVREQRPIRLLIPTLRDLLGL
jgi:hypothetical protein